MSNGFESWYDAGKTKGRKCLVLQAANDFQLANKDGTPKGEITKGEFYELLPEGESLYKFSDDNGKGVKVSESRLGDGFIV